MVFCHEKSNETIPRYSRPIVWALGPKIQDGGQPSYADWLTFLLWHLEQKFKRLSYGYLPWKIEWKHYQILQTHSLGPSAQNPRWRPAIIGGSANLFPMELRTEILVSIIWFFEYDKFNGTIPRYFLSIAWARGLKSKMAAKAHIGYLAIFSLLYL